MKSFFKWTAVIVIVLFAVAFFGVKTIEWYLLPSGHFVDNATPAKPQYNESRFWYALPSIQDTSDLVPPNADTSLDLSEKPADVFFIHSTGYVGPGGWNSSMAIENSETQSLEYMLSSMASAFNGCCDIYAPAYRQAHLTAFSNEDTASSFQALALAYEDVASAFEYFIQHQNDGRPFIIAAHSQGSLHAIRLISEHIDNTALKDRLVAAYTIGYWLPLDMLSRGIKTIPLCDGKDKTQCIVSFDTYGQGGAMSSGFRHWYPSGWETTDGKTIACVNPLNWRTNQELVPATAHKGAYPVEFLRTLKYMILAKNPGKVFEKLSPLTPELTWAQCDQSGVLHVAEQQDNAFSNHLNNADKSYHLLDYGLFYGNIRANAIERTNAFIAR